MRRIVGPQDFKKTSRPAEWDKRIKWWVCKEYEIREGEIIARFHHPFSGGPFDDRWRELRKHWRLYDPMEEVPDLFLRLAYLYEQKDFPKAALNFSTKYGVLGSSSAQWSRTDERISLYSFRQESRRAWLILKLYEAALGRDGQTAEALMYKHALEVLDDSLPSIQALDLVAEHQEEGGFSFDFGFEGPGDHNEERYPYDYNEERYRIGFIEVIEAIQKSVRALCRPTIYQEPGSEQYPDASKLRRGWDYCSLLGAAYLQAFWLITSGDNPSRCEYCRRIMSISQVHPSGRKRRTDKKFCNAACRQAHYRGKQQGEI